MSTIGQRIINVRKNRKISLQELSLKSNISELTLYRIENDKQEPTRDEMLKISDSLDILIEYLGGYSDDIELRKSHVLPEIYDNNLSAEQRISSIEKVSSCSFYLEKVPQDEFVCKHVVRTLPMSLKYVRNQTESICIEAVSSFAYALKYVKNQTEEIAINAVTQNGLALELVNENLHTDKVINRALKQNPQSFKFAKNKTYEICLQAVKLNGVNLEFVPEEFKDRNMIMTALSSNGWAIMFVDKQSEEYALEAVLQNSETALQIDENIRNNNECISIIYKERLKRLPF